MVKNLIKGVIATYKCPECNSQTNEENIEIIGLAGASANLDIICPKCKTHTLFSSHMLQMNIDLNKVAKNGTKIRNVEKISDKEITSLNKDLKKNQINVSDLFE